MVANDEVQSLAVPASTQNHTVSSTVKSMALQTGAPLAITFPGYTVSFLAFISVGLMHKLMPCKVADDHEIANDWDQGKSGVFKSAMDPFLHYHHAVNPPPVRHGGETYYSFTWGSSASFFMLDTRTYRSPNNLPDGPAKSMLGTQQREDLINWLTKDDGGADHGHGEEVQWKFIISSVPFTKNWHFGENDTWAGFLWERQQILEAAWSIGGRSGVVILSGDRHEFAATKFPPPEGSRWAREKGREVAVHEFSCSPLNQFYLPVRTYKQSDEEDIAIK